MKDGGFLLPPGQANVPSTTKANGFWNINEANNRWSNLNYQWPGGKDPFYSSVVGLWHGFPLAGAGGTLDYQYVQDNGPTGSLTLRFFGLIGEIGVGRGAKFGNECMVCSAASSSDFGSTSSSWSPSSGDWTIEGWIYIPTGAALGFVYESRGNPPGVSLHPSIIYNAGALQFYFNGAVQISAPITNDAWHHWAVSKASNSTRVFIDGVQGGSTLADSNTYLTSQIVWFATSNATASLACRMQELRITQGVGRYTATFPVPVYPFPDF